MKKIKLTGAGILIITLGLFSFKENKIIKYNAFNSTEKTIVATDGRYFDIDNVADSTKKKKRKDTPTMPPTDTLPNRKPMDSLNIK